MLPGVLLDLRDWAKPGKPLPMEALTGLDVEGKALLLFTGWSDYWGDERYFRHPCVPRGMAERRQAMHMHPVLVGIDTLVTDSTRDPTRPAHTRLLRSGILIVENLTGLARLIGEAFVFVAAPVKAAGAAAFPVRAFAVLGMAA